MKNKFMEVNKLKKNIILALILAASMTATMTSCGKTGEEVSNGTEQPSYNEAMGIDEAVTEAETEVETEAVTEAEEEVVIEPTQEILDADIDSCKLQLGNKVYTLPVALQTLLDDGATIVNDVNPINDVIGGIEGDYIEFILDNQEYYVCFWNLSIDKKQIKDCFMVDTFPYQEEKIINNNIIYPKGIKVGSTVEELKAAWGEPTKDDLNELNYIDKYTVSIDIEKQLITDIDYRVDPEFSAGYIETNFSARYSLWGGVPDGLKEKIETSATDE